jgi:hypothetical protein
LFKTVIKEKMKISVTAIYGCGECVAPSDWHTSGIPRPYRLYYILGGEAHYSFRGEKHRLLPDHFYLFPSSAPFKVKQNNNDRLDHLYYDFMMTPAVVSAAPMCCAPCDHPLIQPLLTLMRGSVREYRYEGHAELFDTVKYRVPAGMQTSLFSLANIVIQAQINSHGTDAMNGNAASGSIEAFLYTSMFQFSIAALTFTSQSIGARRPDMIKRINRTCSLLVLGVGIIGGIIYLTCGKFLLGLYLPDEPAGAELGFVRLSIIATTYYVLGIQDTVVGTIRGMGYSFASMSISVVGICASRIVWIYTVYQLFDQSLFVLWICFPVSWIITLIAQFFLYLGVRKKTVEKLNESIEKQPIEA